MNCNLKPQSNCAGLRRQRALEIDYELIQQRFVCAIVKEPSKVLIILRAGRIEGDPTVDPTGNLKRGAGVGRWRYNRDFACHSDCGETKRQRKQIQGVSSMRRGSTRSYRRTGVHKRWLGRAIS